MNKRGITLLTILAVVALKMAAGHTLIDGMLEQSNFYGGTVHTFQVYVPDKYDGKRPAALYVGLDGVLCNAPQVMDSLIAARKMPMTIGVFLQPGIVKAADGTVLRYNRCYEFDSTNDCFVRFLDEEVLPAVEQMTTAQGKPIRLSRRPQDRMIFGLSSGGIAAFNAAWHRPDLFGKVWAPLWRCAAATTCRHWSGRPSPCPCGSLSRTAATTRGIRCSAIGTRATRCWQALWSLQAMTCRWTGATAGTT